MVGEDDTAQNIPLPPTEVDAEQAMPVEPREASVLPGAGARLLERARRWASTASAVVLLAGSMVGGRAAHQWITHTPRFGAREIEVVGNHRTRRDEVLAAARVQPGTNVLGLDALRAERAVEELPWVERAQVTRRLPGYVRIEVEERTAAAIVSAGGLYLCAQDGTLFKRVQQGDPTDLPIITGIARAEFERDPDAARENVRDALALLADLASSSLGGRVRLEEVHRDATGDLSVVLASGVYVWLGRGPYRAKMARLSAILAELERQRIDPAEIHLESDRHPERATVRVRVPHVEPAPAAAPPPRLAIGAGIPAAHRAHASARRPRRHRGR